jgi:hypothetical protein
MPFARPLAIRLHASALTSLLALAIISCGGSGDSTGPPAPVAVASVALTAPTNTLTVGQTVQLSAATKDASGNVLTGHAISWSSSSTAIATVSTSGLVTAVTTGTATIFASSEGKSGSVTITVNTVPVNLVTLTPPTSTVLVGQTLQLAAVTTDAGGHTLTGRTITWTTAAPSVATVSTSGLVTAVAVGSANITATSEGKADTTAITVQVCGTGLQLAVGDVHVLTTAEKASLCLSNGSTAAEYALVSFNNSTVASSTTPVKFTATNTAAVLAPLTSRQGMSSGTFGARSIGPSSEALEVAFRARERTELEPRLRSMQAARSAHGPLSPFLTGISATPAVGSIVQINSNLSGSLCSAKVLHPAKVLAVMPHTIVLSDTLSPAGGYTAAEMIAFGQAFDTLGYPLDTLNFGTPSDIDANGRVAILFTPGVNVIPAPPGAVVLGLQTTRDLIPVASCAGSNEGEMFYMPVPDPNSTINGAYTNEAFFAQTVETTLVHEFQHLINAGRRVYVLGTTNLEEVWLNEGLSHIAEELLYYKESGNSPKTNIDIAKINSTQAQLDAANIYVKQDLLRLQTYLVSPEINSPYSQVDGLEMRGSIWQLLRYSADRKGGTERSTWYSLVNTTSTGQANFNAVFGSITTMAHDWSIAQIADDGGLTLNANYTNPSWNFRNVLTQLSGTSTFPLLTHSLVSTPVNVSINGGGAAYMRFRVAASTVANLTASSSTQPVPSSVDLTLVRTQ